MTMGIREYLERKRDEREKRHPELKEKRWERMEERRKFSEMKSKAYVAEKERRMKERASREGKAQAEPTSEKFERIAGRVAGTVVSASRTAYKGVGRRPRGRGGRYRRSRAAPRGQTQARGPSEAGYAPFGGSIGVAGGGGSLSFGYAGPERKKKKNGNMGMFGGNI